MLVWGMRGVRGIEALIRGDVIQQQHPYIFIVISIDDKMDDEDGNENENENENESNESSESNEMIKEAE